ncbi:MAG: DUF5989 family protein [Flagellimonas sp.]
MEFLKEFFLFLKYRKKFWLVPLILLLLLFSLIITLTASSALAPFIYTIF